MDSIALTFIIIGSIILGLLLLSLLCGVILLFFCSHHDHLYTNLVECDNEELTKAFNFSKDNGWFYQDNFFEYISIKSFDNKKISSYIHKEKDSHLYIIFAHGYTGSPDEKAHCLHDLYDKYHCNILSMEQRGQTKSEINYLTMGYKESKDLKSWSDYIVSKDNKAQIIAYGESMGAATVLTGLNFHYNDHVKGVIADSSYTSIHSQYIFSSKHIVPLFLSAYVIFGSIMAYFFFHHMRTIKYSPLAAIKNKTIPVCFIHGEIDSIVSYKSFLKFKKYINPHTESTFESFPNTDHVAGYYTDTKRYLNILKNFINKVIEK